MHIRGKWLLSVQRHLKWNILGPAVTRALVCGQWDLEVRCPNRTFDPENLARRAVPERLAEPCSVLLAAKSKPVSTSGKHRNDTITAVIAVDRIADTFESHATTDKAKL